MSKIPVYQIDSSVPVPEQIGMPLDQLKVGESFVFPLSKRPSAQSRVSKVKKETGKDFTIKKQDAETARVWRTK